MNHEAKALKALRKRLSQLSGGTHSKAELYVIKEGIKAMEQAIQRNEERVLMEQVIDEDIYDIYGINQLYEKLFK